MVMTDLANLDKTDAPLEVIDNTLVTIGRPPFDGEVVLPTSDNEPERSACQPERGKFLREQPLSVAQIDVAAKAKWYDRDSEPLTQVCHEAVYKMIWALVTLMNKRVVTLNLEYLRIGFAQRSD
jgi:hypothetical protein